MPNTDESEVAQRNALARGRLRRRKSGQIFEVLARMPFFLNYKMLRYLLLLVVVGVSWGDIVAVAPIGGTANRSDSTPYMLGWEFSVSAPLTITALAYLDATGAGLADSHMVGIFDAVTGNLLVSATVPSGAATKSLNGFRIVPVTESLPPGTYVIGGQRLTNDDGAFLLSTSVATIPGVTYLQERELQTSSFVIPSTDAPQAGIGVFGPSFVVASSAQTPSITGVSNSASYQPIFAPLTYMTIYGTNLSTTARGWLPSDFVGGTELPVSLDGVSVTVNGTPAYVQYIGATQINIITPATTVTGKGIPVVVSTPNQTTATAWIGMQTIAPSLFTWSTGVAATTDIYAIAQHVGYTNVGKAGLIPSMPVDFTTPAVPGEEIMLYGTGFGPTTPPIAAGIITNQIYNLDPLPTATLGGLPAQVDFAGLIPTLSQVYQINVTVPATIGSGDWPLVLNVNGITSYPALVTVQQ